MARFGSIRVVATDLDGTLLDPRGAVSARTAAAVESARKAGIHVMAVTARPPQATWDLVRAAGLGPYAVCSNGAVVIDTERGRIVHVQALTGALEILGMVRTTLPGSYFASDDLDCFYHETGFFDDPVDWDEKLEEVAEIGPIVERGCVTLLARSPGVTGGGLVEQLAPVLARRARVTTAGVDWAYITAAAVSKAFGLALVCESLGVASSEVVAVGDNHNDIDLLAWAGTAMAPANAIPPVLAAAQRVLPGNDADGVASFLEELVAAGGALPVPAVCPDQAGIGMAAAT